MKHEPLIGGGLALILVGLLVGVGIVGGQPATPPPVEFEWDLFEEDWRPAFLRVDYADGRRLMIPARGVTLLRYYPASFPPGPCVEIHMGPTVHRLDFPDTDRARELFERLFEEATEDEP